MIKKSFHLEEEDLQTATSRAETLGLPLNAYLRQAVINENDQRKVAEGNQSHLQGIYKALEELTQEMGLVRVASDDAQEASQQREQELIQKVSESLEEHRQQVGGMLRQFLHIVTNGAKDALEQEAEPTPTTGRHAKKASWENLPTIESLQSKRK